MSRNRLDAVVMEDARAMHDALPPHQQMLESLFNERRATVFDGSPTDARHERSTAADVV